MKRATILATALLVTLTACGDNEANTQNEAVDNATNEQGNEINEPANNEPSDNNETSVSEEEVNEEDATGEFPVTVTDASGEEVTIEEEPESIVSLLPSNTEIGFALGLGDKFVGVTEYCNYPVEASEVESIGAMDVDVERILELAPDLALVAEYHASSNPEMLDQFESVGIDVLVVDGANSFDETYEMISIIGEATGTDDVAEEIISDIQAQVSDIEELSANVEETKTVWVEVGPSPEIYTTGTNTFMHEMLEIIGAENAAGEFEGWVNLSEEEIIALQPDTIVTTYGDYIEDPLQEVTGRNGWQEVPAVMNEDIHDVDSDMVTRFGPRLADGLQLVAEAVYPDVYNQ
ncbi:ABC transporter substrate-binding protein [Paenalkalicoccus suaedae]|uniref:ABC transporter substrate-binding protein n=1 Tax=Paenalkalicoccus suaedae TaxID=2592382 RepID=A0A859FB71_9BACI|nr:ABC transporter substrate-binding protein [Paenalkalicoccus suaedae]QKS70058.1 ABC transporter substrate-binding protein [Paenalkalicoccus suaedae]